MNMRDLTRFSTYVVPIDLTFNQYLLRTTSYALLVHTGNMTIGKSLLANLQDQLGKQKLDAIFISHFESDECGALSLFVAAYPEVTVYCSEVTSRELKGFGIEANTVVVTDEARIENESVHLSFITYPSEVHLWNGLLLVEEKRKILFSSDLVFAFGDSRNEKIEKSWSECIDSNAPYQIPNPSSLDKLKITLSQKDVAYVAPGHGPEVEIIQ